LGLFIVAAIPFMFWAPLDLSQFRLTPFLWNLGHLLLFFAVGWFVLNCLHRYLNTKFILLFIGFNAVVFMFGVLIEEIQLPPVPSAEITVLMTFTVTAWEHR